jgi:hypothetical protein
MHDKRVLIFPIIFALVLVPVFVVALFTYQPNKDCTCNCAAIPVTAPHSHGAGIARTVVDDMQLILNVSAAAQLYQLVDGQLQLCGGDVTDTNLKHVTLDVIDARLAVGERLPVTVDLVITRHADGAVVVEAGAPAMYAPGHGYHFGDNFLLPPGVTYDWQVTVSPVHALRQDGAQNVWLEPVTWSGNFTIDADNTVVGKAPSVQTIGQFAQDGLHVMMGTEPARALYEVGEDGTTTPQIVEPGSRYYVVDVTDHAVNYEEKLVGATVVVTFSNGTTELTVPFEAVISPEYGFHYGANVALEPGAWRITIDVGGLDFLRHAGAALSLARGTVSGSFNYTVE